MAEAKVYVSVREYAIRIAPHLYHDESDIEKLFAVIRKLIYSKIEFEQFYYCLAPTQ
jgi:selenocysteine lyase/cysteine desulfurase